MLNSTVSATLLGFVRSVNTVTLTAHFVLREGHVGIAFAAMLRAFFIPLCSLQNTLPPKVFFKFFKEQILSFFDKFAGF